MKQVNCILKPQMNTERSSASCRLLYYGLSHYFGISLLFFIMGCCMCLAITLFHKSVYFWKYDIYFKWSVDIGLPCSILLTVGFNIFGGLYKSLSRLFDCNVMCVF